MAFDCIMYTVNVGPTLYNRFHLGKPTGLLSFTRPFTSISLLESGTRVTLDDLYSKLSLFFIVCQQGIQFLHECDAMFCGVIHNTKLSRYILHNHVVMI